MSDIRDKFGDEVATLVDGASKPEELIHADVGKSKTWPERKAHTIDFIKNAGRDMKLFSCADKLSNIFFCNVQMIYKFKFHYSCCGYIKALYNVQYGTMDNPEPTYESRNRNRYVFLYCSIIFDL